MMGTLRMFASFFLALSLPLAVFGGPAATFPVPSPYRWDESFTVKMPQMDDEHRGLFNGLLMVERDNNQKNLDAAIIKYRDHFTLEESLFEQTMSADYADDHKGKHADFMNRFTAWTSPVATGELSWAKNW